MRIVLFSFFGRMLIGFCFKILGWLTLSSRVNNM